jgi:hypothetical protein
VDTPADSIRTSEQAHSRLHGVNKTSTYSLRFFVSITDIDDCLLRVYKPPEDTADITLHALITALYTRQPARRYCLDAEIQNDSKLLSGFPWL